MNQVHSEEERRQQSLYTEKTHGCSRPAQAPYGNSEYARDNGLNPTNPRPSEFPAGETAARLLAPGSATVKSLNAIGDWIENGIDGKADGPWEQLGRAIPGALLMGPTAMLASSVDTITGLFGWDPFGDD